MLIAVIQVKDYHSAKQQLRLAQSQADGVELRLDYANTVDVNVVAALRREFHLPMIFTLRKKSQGGFYEGNEEQRLQDLLSLCQLNPDYIDFEHDTRRDFLQTIHCQYPNIKLICSYHNFVETPADLKCILQSMQHACFYAYKITTQANKTLDALRMLNFVKLLHKEYRLTGICMGEDGQSTRILSSIVGNAMTYASLNESQATASGQLSIQDLLSIYHFRKLNTASKIYALLGDPVHLSVGHVVHNQAIELLKENAIYIKLRVTQADLPTIIAQCRSLSFAGFSITMPLKETILPFIDIIEPVSQPIKAINTVINRQDKFIGFNTDGIGAIKTLNKKIPLTKQKIVILGAGGAARAIAYEALKHHAYVIILNRTLSKAKQLANELGCDAYELNSLPMLKNMNYSVLINTLPGNVYTQKTIQAMFQHNNLLPNTVAMDIVYSSLNTAFLCIAQCAGCICIFGYEMYIEQALMQIARWFQPNEENLKIVGNRMHQYFLQQFTQG